MARNFLFILLATLVSSVTVLADESSVPTPFRGFDPTSTYHITYDDLDALLRLSVVDVGRSTREGADARVPRTGTRITGKINRKTVNEGNRFYFEAFHEDRNNREILHNIRLSLEKVPDAVPLDLFSRDEQLAYWLNLYNVTLLDEIVAEYPIRKLEKLLTGRKSILDKKVLTVAGVPLSLNDIQFTILRENYDNNSLIMYGLYQGIIGGPNIRKAAYRGDDVYQFLVRNAVEFVNSNRGSYVRNEKEFRASSLYERNKVYFPDFENDLKEHLLRYLDEGDKNDLVSASRIRTNIDDWTITDLYGTYRQAGGSLADNPAALLDSMNSTRPTETGGTLTTSLGAQSASLAARATIAQRFSPDLVAHLKELDRKRELTAEGKTTVTIEEVEKPE